jgi:putative membrane protein
VNPGTYVEGLLALGGPAAAVAYLMAAARLRRRGDRWPWPRSAAFTAGGGTLVLAAAVPPAGGPFPGPFTAHAAQHLLAGMVAPLLLVLGRPVTLALRALGPGTARRRLRGLAHARAAGLLLFPPLAALLDMGGLWLLHRTELLAAAPHGSPLHALVTVHVVAAGLAFTAAVCQLDPVRRRWGVVCRGGTLLAAGAVHAALAKSLYATGPPGTAFTATDRRAAAQLLYYGGDLAEAALALVVALSWYAAAGRALRRRGRAARRDGARPAPARRAACRAAALSPSGPGGPPSPRGRRPGRRRAARGGRACPG